MILHFFPQTVVTNCPKLGGLQKQKWTLAQFGELEDWKDLEKNPLPLPSFWWLLAVLGGLDFRCTIQSLILLSVFSLCVSSYKNPRYI